MKKKKIPEHIIHTDYLGKVYYVNTYIKTIARMTAAIKKFQKRYKFDAIAFTGSSGAAMAYPLSLRLKLPLICVRKNDKNHWGHPIEGCISAKKYIIIDDFISDGNTMNKILSSIKEKIPRAEAVGIFLYNSYPRLKKWKKIPIYYPDAIKQKK